MAGKGCFNMWSRTRREKAIGLDSSVSTAPPRDGGLVLNPDSWAEFGDVRGRRAAFL